MEEGELSVGYDEDMSLSVRQIGNQIQAEAQSFLNQVQEILPGFVDTPEDMEVRRRISWANTARNGYSRTQESVNPF